MFLNKFSTSEAICDVNRFKEGIIDYYITMYYNGFSFLKILLFLIDSLDVKALKDNFNLIKKIMNPFLTKHK